MADNEKKFDILCKVGALFNREKITWAVGASLLLYFEGITETFHDIDLMVHEKDADKAKKILLSLGTMHPAHSAPQFTTKYFHEFVIDDVEVDMMAGFGMIYDGKEYDCSLLESQIVKYKELNGVSIPLQSVRLWREYYRLMGRDSKVAMIDSSFPANKDA